ncbi:MAG: Gfo/Idh/MocA family oxidoreductase [Saprospiraceae bacterium]|nr:Gfo/Idh/MocA family oxidoreductase [Saprospiraceae bacterium]
MQKLGIGATAVGAFSLTSCGGHKNLPKDADGNVIPGFEEVDKKQTKQIVPESSDGWQSKSDRKIRVGIAGYGLCHFGASFSYQNHPNVEVVAASDLDPARCAALAKAVGAPKTYSSCEEMIKDKSIEAIYIATDAPSHARLAIMALNHDKHVVSAVPAVFGFEAEGQAEELFNAVKRSGMKYMMNETSTFHADLYEKRKQYQAGALGKIVYSEGEYYHDFGLQGLTSFNPKNGEIDYYGWRRGLPPMWYPTHSTAYYISVSGGRLTEVSALGTTGIYDEYKDNQYNNPFGTEVAMFKTSEDGISRMAVSWDMKNAHGEKGRVYGQQPHDEAINGARPPLPPGVEPGGHGGSHGQLTNNFIESILLDQKPIVDVSEALNMTLAGVIAHQSALNGGEWMKIPQYEM